MRFLALILAITPGYLYAYINVDMVGLTYEMTASPYDRPPKFVVDKYQPKPKDFIILFADYGDRNNRYFISQCTCTDYTYFFVFRNGRTEIIGIAEEYGIENKIPTSIWNGLVNDAVDRAEKAYGGFSNLQKKFDMSQDDISDSSTFFSATRTELIRRGYKLRVGRRIE